MSSCEKCWADAYRIGGADQAEEYLRLVKERDCRPEDQAGPDALWCTECHRRTLHQHTQECMTPGCDGGRLPRAPRGEGRPASRGEGG